MSKTSIVARKMGIEFPITSSEARSLRNVIAKQAVGAIIRKLPDGSRATTALANIDLDLKDGDRLGLVGHNGAGKSTLLRAIAGVYPITSGSLECRGSISTLFNLAFGIEPDLSGRENILLRALYAGHDRKYIMSKFDEITEFTGLGDFLDLPVGKYSSGMKLRLAFGVMTSFPADILLIDESIGVGDADFKKKSQQKMNELIAQSGILILASHSPDILKAHCNKFLKLEHGQAVSLTTSL